MNDLERDLTTLFRKRAESIEAPPLAPDDVLRRGHRRQIRTIVGGSLVALVSIAAAIIAIGAVRPGPDTLPVAPSGPERTATINGITVTAPAGWTLIDDWPMASILPASSQTCTFSATGVPVAPSPQEAIPSTGAIAEPSGSCETHTTPLPAGVPVLQLTNFGSRLDGTVCDVDPLHTVEVPSDGVAVYVAAFPDGMTTADFVDACPGGGTVTTFADDSYTMTYAAVSIIGPDASVAAVATIDRLMNSLDGLRIRAGQPATISPGFVVGAGVDGHTTWRLEAGFLVRGSGSAIGATLITTGTDGHDSASAPVAPATSEGLTVRTQQLTDGSGALLWGTAPPAVTAITNIASDGTRTSATLVPWPEGMRETTPVQERSQLDGSIWFAVVPEPGRLEINAPDSVSPSPVSLAASALDYRVTDHTVTATGYDLGHDWKLRLEGTELTLSLDAAPPQGGFSVAPQGSGGQLDVPGGTFLFSAESRRTTGLRVTSDVAGNEIVGIGRWMPGGSDVRGSGRVWIVALPGAGTGYEQVVGRLPMAMSWPNSGVPTAGTVLSASSDGSVSWAIRWTVTGCPALDVVASTNGLTGTSDCLTPWDGSDPAVAGVTGPSDAVVVLTGPGRMLCDVEDPSHQVEGGVSGGTIAQVNPWTNTGSCIAVIPLDHPVTVHLTDMNGKPILGERGSVTVRAHDGSLAVVP
jgi:hypothetical protein